MAVTQQADGEAVVLGLDLVAILDPPLARALAPPLARELPVVEVPVEPRAQVHRVLVAQVRAGDGGLVGNVDRVPGGYWSPAGPVLSRVRGVLAGVHRG